MNRAYFVSDIHLFDTTSPNAVVFLRFLEQLKTEKPRYLFLVGDIFDLWVGGHAYFRKKFAPILKALKELRANGVEIHFFEGNHDFHLEKFWQAEMGVTVHPDNQTFRLFGQSVRVEHGDLINPDDRGYLFLRWFMRTPILRALALHLPSGVVHRIGERASRASREYTSTAKELPVEEIRGLIRAHAKRVYAAGPFDLIVTGHVHVLDDANVEGARSVNLGTWTSSNRPAFVLSEAGGEWVNLQ